MSSKLFVLLMPVLFLLLNVVGCNESTSIQAIDKIEALNAQEEEVVGFCSEWKSNNGNAFLILVENGKVKSIIAN